MFGGAANPYDEIIIKATDENLASEDWALNMEVCDKVSGDGTTGARNAVAALQKRLSHRNPNVQLYALELANTLAQNCGKPLLEELASRNWTQALDRLVNDRATSAAVKKKALGYIKAWAKQFEETGDSNLGLMGELYDQLRAKNFAFDEPEPVPEDRARTRQEAEDDELQRVLELSKQDRGGRGQSGFGGGSSSSSSQPQPPPPSQRQHQPPVQQQPQYVLPPPAPEPEPAPLDINTATRVRALYTFSSNEVGELSFERGDVIKVLDRGFQEWWRGACNGKIGIFPVTYVEPLQEPTTTELQREAQEEAQVFASLGLVDQLLQTLKEIDPSRGDRLDDRPEVEAMYQDSVKLQGQINALIKKYSDQKAELEHMNANFNRAMRQYEEMRTAPPPMPQHHSYGPPAPGYGQSPDPSYAQQPPPQQSYGQHPPQQAYPPQEQYQQHPPGPAPGNQPTQFPQANPAQAPHHQGESAPGQPFYAQHQNPSRPGLERAPSGAPSFPPNEPHRQATEPGAAGMGAADRTNEHAAAWEAYYRQQAEAQGQAQQPQQQPYQGEYGASPYPPAGQQQPPQGQRQPSYGQGGHVDGVADQMGRMSVHGS